MKMRLFLPLCVVCTLLLGACSKADESTNREATNSSAKTATPAPSTAVLISNDKIGVAECDDFIAAYDACVSSKVPEAARAQYKASIDQWRSSWKTLAANPQTRGTLAAACKQSAEQAKVSLKAYNCTF